MKKLLIYLLLSLLSVQLLKAQDTDYSEISLQSNLRFSAVDSTVVNIEDFNSRITVLYFWTSWNGESRKQLQYISSLSRKMVFRPVTFVAVSLDVNRDVWLSYVNRLGSGTIVQLYAGNDKEIRKQFNILSVPSIAILNKDSYMIPEGDSYDISNKLEETLVRLLENKSGTSPLSDAIDIMD